MNRKGKKNIQPKNTPIYRASERLLSWAFPIVNSLPKSLACQTLGAQVIRDLHDSLNAITIALRADDKAQKAQCIKLLTVHLTAVQTAMRIFTENRSISLKQEAEFLDLVNPITVQAEAWLSKWETGANAVAELS